MYQETMSPPMVAPLGKIRHPLAPLGLSIITLGIYMFVWLYKILEEMRRHSNLSTITSGALGVGLMFVPIFNVFWTIYLWFRVPMCINMMKSACNSADKSELSPAIGLFQLIPLVGGIIWAAMIQDALNNHWRSHGAQV